MYKYTFWKHSLPGLKEEIIVIAKTFQAAVELVKKKMEDEL